MRVRDLLPFVFVLLVTPQAHAQTTDPVAGLLVRVQAALAQGTPDALIPLLAQTADRDQVAGVASEVSRTGLVRVTLKERDRQPLTDGGLRLLVDLLAETSSQGYVATWRVDLEPPPTDSLGTTEGIYRIRTLARLSMLDALFRLSLADRQYAVSNLTLLGEDIAITVAQGTAWMAEVNGLPTALVVFGDAEVVFAPTPASEQGQLELFSGERQLRSRVSRLFVRLSPSDADRRMNMDALRPMPTDRQALSRARDFFNEYVARSFSLDLQDLSPDTWSLVPPLGDLLVDFDTARYGVLTYSRSGGDSEDISVFDRRRRKNLSVYSSERQLAQRGTRHYDEAAQLDYVIEHYNVDVHYDPGRAWFEGRADLEVQVRAATTTTLTLRLAEALTVRAVTSDQFGRLLTLRVRGQNNVIVNLPGALRRGDRLTLRVVYGGHLPPHQPDREVATVAGQPSQDFVLEPEPRFTYSNRSWWYPQTPVSTYATARMRVTVPAAYTCIGSGMGEPPETLEGPDGKLRRAFVFKATQPVRYLSFVVSRFDMVKAASIVRPTANQLAVSAGTRLSRLRPGAFYEMTDVEVWTQRRQTSRADDLLRTATDMVRFYQDIVDDAPYPVLRIVAVEDNVPGGHSPAYFAMLHQPLPVSPFTWGRDPVAFDNYPDFFLAHEIAHQFWGQAVGWESYHEQWISEAFAQYFAAMYAERTRPPDTFVGILRQMNRSALDAGSQGPVWLGYRLGHLKNDGRVFRAVVYNKGALVLHMLRRMVGDEVFTRGLQRFYGVSRFRRVGTDDLRAAFEYETGRSLELFFERWIYEADVPTLQTSWTVDDPMTSSGGALAGNGASPVVRIRIEQDGARLYTLPLTVTVVFADGKTERAIAQIEGETTELVVPVTRAVRDVRFNDDSGALVRFGRTRR
jgi:hypothetical protein